MSVIVESAQKRVAGLHCRIEVRPELEPDDKKMLPVVQHHGQRGDATRDVE